MVFNGPKWFGESGHPLAGHLGQACQSANWQASLFVLSNNKCQWIRGLTCSEHFQHLTLMKNQTTENKIFCVQEFSKHFWTEIGAFKSQHCWHFRPMIICNGMRLGSGTVLIFSGSLKASVASTPYLPVTTPLKCDNKNVSRHVFWGTKLSLLENYFLRVNINSSQFNISHMVCTTISDNQTISPRVLQAHEMSKDSIFSLPGADKNRKTNYFVLQSISAELITKRIFQLSLSWPENVMNYHSFILKYSSYLCFITWDTHARLASP